MSSLKNKTFRWWLDFFLVLVACVAGVQRGGRGEVECEREARPDPTIALRARIQLPPYLPFVGRPRAPSYRASRSHSISPLPPLCKPATQAIVLVTRERVTEVTRCHVTFFLGLFCNKILKKFQPTPSNKKTSFAFLLLERSHNGSL